MLALRAMLKRSVSLVLSAHKLNRIAAMADSRDASMTPVTIETRARTIAAMYDSIPSRCSADAPNTIASLVPAVSARVWRARVAELAVRAFVHPRDYTLASLVAMAALSDACDASAARSPSVVVFQALTGEDEFREAPSTTTARATGEGMPERTDGVTANEDDDDNVLARCHKCQGRAVFTQKQTRSADEGCTIFWRCTRCGHQWVRS